MIFDLASCREYAARYRLDAWVDDYLRGGPWANEGLREGLRRATRHWSGPHLIALNRLERCCDPEPDMEYCVPLSSWQHRVSAIAGTIDDPSKLPPLIVEYRSGALSIRDGSHRYGAMTQAGWSACWVIVWCNSASDAADFRAMMAGEAGARQITRSP
jgi:hypothetical protein